MLGQAGPAVGEWVHLCRMSACEPVSDRLHKCACTLHVCVFVAHAYGSACIRSCAPKHADGSHARRRCWMCMIYKLHHPCNLRHHSKRNPCNQHHPRNLPCTISTICTIPASSSAPLPFAAPPQHAAPSPQSSPSPQPALHHPRMLHHPRNLHCTTTLIFTTPTIHTAPGTCTSPL